MAYRYDLETDTLRLSVGDLLAAERRGEPGSSGIPDRSALGRLIHDRVVEARAMEHPDYRRETPLEYRLKLDNATIFLRGRADGVYIEGEHHIVEEIKSVGEISSPLLSHRLQCGIYAWMYSLIHHLRTEGQLTLVDVFTGETAEYRVSPEADGVEDLVLAYFRSILAQSRREAERLAKRQRQAERIRWPFPGHRPGQEEIEAAVGNALDSRRHLLLEAPTGSGKTAPILLTALRWCVENRCRLAFATSRTAQQRDRVELLKRAAPSEALGRVLVLGAAERLCSDPNCGCRKPETDVSVNPKLAAEPWENLRGRENFAILTPADVIRLAANMKTCARTLQRLLARWADIIIGDQNLLADPMFHPSGWFSGNGSPDTVLLVDEIHGLPDRIISRRSIRLFADNLSTLGDELVFRGGQTALEAASALRELKRRLLSCLASGDTEQPDRYEIIAPDYPDFREPLLRLQLSLSLSSGRILSNKALDTVSQLLLAAAAVEEPHGYTAFLDRGNGSVGWELLDTGLVLKHRWERARNIIGFSATLTPAAWNQERLGLPTEHTDFHRLPEFTPPEQRLVLRYAGLSTAYAERSRSLPALVDLLIMAAVSAGGNLVVFFPSHAYLESTAALLATRRKEIRVNLPERRDQLFASVPDSDDTEKPMLHLMVLGGKLSEGIGLSFPEIAGVVVIGPGVPPLSEQRELLRERIDTASGDGFRYVYLYPGLVRVVQSCGRLFRDEQMRGIILLVGKRFANPEVEDSLPESWRDSAILTEIPEIFATLRSWSAG